MRFEFIRVEKGNFPVSILCCVLEVSRSGFYAWRTRPPCSRSIADAQLTVTIRQIHTNTAVETRIDSWVPPAIAD